MVGVGAGGVITVAIHDRLARIDGGAAKAGELEHDRQRRAADRRRRILQTIVVNVGRGNLERTGASDQQRQRQDGEPEASPHCGLPPPPGCCGGGGSENSKREGCSRTSSMTRSRLLT